MRFGAINAEDLAQGTADPSVYDSLAATIISNEVAFRAYAAEMSDLRAAHMRLGVRPDDWDQKEATYRAAFVEHNEHKFFAFLVDGLRTRLAGKVKAPDVGVLRANSGVVSSFLLRWKREDLLALERSGHVVGFSVFPPALILISIAAAVIIVSAVSAVYAYAARQATNREEARQASVQAAIACEQSGKCKPGTSNAAIAMAQEAAKNDGKGGLLGDLAGLVKWGVIAIIAVNLIPAVAGAFKKRSS